MAGCECTLCTRHGVSVISEVTRPRLRTNWGSAIILYENSVLVQTVRNCVCLNTQCGCTRAWRKIACYCRVSTEDQTLECQLTSTQEYAERGFGPELGDRDPNLAAAGRGRDLADRTDDFTRLVPLRLPKGGPRPSAEVLEAHWSTLRAAAAAFRFARWHSSHHGVPSSYSWVASRSSWWSHGRVPPSVAGENWFSRGCFV